MRCDMMVANTKGTATVSIHTPTWGVTVDSTQININPKVSIHTPTWGVTTWTSDIVSAALFQSTHLHEVWLHYSFLPYPIRQFQSTHLHEVWLRDVILHKKGNVSIHTPTWGVTRAIARARANTQFQSTHLHEVWRLHGIKQTIWSEFQSTHLHEVWHLIPMWRDSS